MRKIKEQVKTNPALLDMAIESYKKQLVDDISWLDQSFGRAWNITKIVNGRKYTEPCVYTGDGNEYETLIPSEDLGNYSFFEIHDPTNVDDNVTARVSLIVWVNLDKVFSTTGIRDTEKLKLDLIRTIREDLWSRNGKFELERIYEDAKNVFNGYTIDENDNQCMMHPYAGFRLEGTMTINIPTC